jgi:phage tail protein X
MATIHIETITVTQEGITLSRLLWRRFGRRMPGLHEKVLDLNVGLADLGAEIPVGTALRVPIETPDVEVRTHLRR